jgi:hypothetical protein
MKLPIYSYETDNNGYPTGKLKKILKERPPEKKGQHFWVAACDKNGNEVFGYCMLCGKKN